MIVVVIPAYQPDEKLVELVETLDRQIVVVDDGSGSQYKSIFDRVERAGAVVLRHEKNNGKGCALKTAFQYAVGIDWVVTADSDGQHTVDDIEKIIRATENSKSQMIIGARRFVGYVPLRSKIGNELARLIFKYLTRIELSDTQSGLRAYKGLEVHNLCHIPGERYEYEMNCLLYYKDGIQEIPIETVYEKGNGSSHYRPLKDSIKIWKSMINRGKQ